LEAVVLVAIGRLVFNGSERLRPTLAADLAAAASQPATIPILVALATGGLFLGIWAARTHGSDTGDSPSNIRTEPTRAGS
jgi:hypothetical protein